MNSTGEWGTQCRGLGLELGGSGLNLSPRLALRALCVAFGDRVLWKAQRSTGAETSWGEHGFLPCVLSWEIRTED